MGHPHPFRTRLASTRMLVVFKVGQAKEKVWFVIRRAKILNIAIRDFHVIVVVQLLSGSVSSLLCCGTDILRASKTRLFLWSTIHRLCGIMTYFNRF